MAVPSRSEGAHTDARAKGVKASVPWASADHASVYTLSPAGKRAIWGRLDRLIERVRSVAKGAPPDPMNHLLADLLERGEVSGAATRRIRELYRRQVEKSG